MILSKYLSKSSPPKAQVARSLTKLLTVYGEADGIISWLPDRLSRNPVDSGLLLYLLDEGILVDLKFPHFWFENTPQGKYMLSLEFSQSKHFVDNLSENVKRGLRIKVRRGEMPGIAPIGYINNKNTKRIVLDRCVAPKITKAFKLYAQGDKTMSEISQYLYDNGVKTDGRYNKRKSAIKRGGNKIKDDRIKKILKNPFTTAILCITTSCTKANIQRLSQNLCTTNTSASWNGADERTESSHNLSDGEDLRRQVADLTAKQKLLLDDYLDQVIDRQTFTEKKAELMSQ